jgi:hypothetical protein
MKLIILHLVSANKSSPMSEAVVEIRIDCQPCKGINLTTWHIQARRAPRVATIHDVTKKPGRVLPCPSVIFHTYTSVDTPWVTQTLSHCTPVKRGKVSSNSSTHEATQFVDSICPICVSIFQMLVHLDPINMGLKWHRQGYHLGASNFRSDHSPSFPSSILHFPLIAMSDLQLCQPLDHLAKSHRTSIDRKCPIASGFQPLVFYRYPTPLSIAYYRYFSFIGINKVV